MDDAQRGKLVEFYQKYGYINPITVLTAEEASEIFTQLVSPSTPLSSYMPPLERLVGNFRFKTHLYSSFINKIVHSPSILDVVEAVLGTPNILLWSSDFNIKLPGSDGFFALHQDATYTGLSPADKCVTVWVALTDPVDDEHGCLWVLPGSHLAGQLPHQEGKGSRSKSSLSEDDDEQNDLPYSNEDNMLSRGQKIILPHNININNRAIPMVLRIGEASMHHFHTVHFSGPNRSTTPRVGLALRYIAASVKQTGKTMESVTVVRGKEEHNGFIIEPVLPLNRHPTPSEFQLGVSTHQDAMKRETSNYFCKYVNGSLLRINNDERGDKHEVSNQYK